MSIRDRLGRLTGEDRKPVQTDPKQERLSELRRKIDEVMNRRERLVPQSAPRQLTGAVPLERVVTGEEVEAAGGRFFFSRSVLTGTDTHGHARIGELADACMETAAFLAGSEAIRRFSIEDGLFLDTETTGLAGGTGTFPFLVGLGWFEGDSFVTCQLFARDFSEERAVLVFLTEAAYGKRFLVTFNGRAYDLNLLASRFILNRSKDTLSGMPHVDLLHPSRRVFAHRLENARLVTLEASILGVRRTDDVPGHEIPQRYFDWLKSKDGRLMEDVFRHNRLDIVSMASLLKQLTDLVKGFPGCEESHHHGDLLCAARLHLDRGSSEAALRMLGPLACSNIPEVAAEAKKTLSLIHKRSGSWGEAASIWQEMLAADATDLFAAVELAKYHEHRSRDLGRALAIVRAAHEGGAFLSHEDRLALEHRLQRLLEKVSRKGGW